MSKVLPSSTRSFSRFVPSPAPCERINRIVRAQRVEHSRRHLASGLLTSVLWLNASSPAEAVFGLEGEKLKNYAAETTTLLGTVKNIVSLPRDDPQRESDVSKVRDMTNKWVAKYRRDTQFAGRQSFSNTYSVVNALSGHFNSFGTDAPLPKKRLERLLKEVNDAERFLSRGR